MNKEEKRSLCIRFMQSSNHKDFAKEHNIGLSTLYKWLRMYKNELNQTKERNDFVKLDPKYLIDDTISFKINNIDISIDSTNLKLFLEALK